MMWRVAIVLNLAFPSAVSGNHVSCKTTTLEDNVTLCIVEDRRELPSFPDEADYEIVFCSRPVQGTGSVVLSEAFGFVHTAIGLKARDASKVYTFEFWALHFTPQGILTPRMESGTLTWANEAVVSWAPAMSKEYWTHQVSLGFANGTILNQFMDWVFKWHEAHRYYQLFAVWDQPELGPSMNRYFDDTTCNTFTEDGLTELHRLGAPLMSDEVLCRTYFVFNSQGPLQSVRHFSLKYLEMLAYYDTLGIALGKFRNMTLRKALELVAVALGEKSKPFAFIYDRDRQIYYKVLLQSPYIEAWPMYLSQRMLLPWQPLENARSKECDPWGANVESTLMV